MKSSTGEKYYTIYKTFLLSLALSLLTPSVYAQMQGGKLYIYPQLLIKVDSQLWETGNYSTFLNSLNGFAELKAKSNPTTILNIRPYTSATDTTQYQTCKCNPEYLPTYPRYGKVLQSRSLVMGRDTFYLSIHQSHEKEIWFHMATCRTDLYSCMLRISAVGPVKDSTFIKESLMEVNRNISTLTPAQADSLFGLPMSGSKSNMLAQQQLASYDKVWQEQYQRDLNASTEQSRAYLIKTIRELHATNYTPVGWTLLPALDSLSIDSLVRIKARYYHLSYIGGPASIQMATHFFPPRFTYALYKQSIDKLVKGEFSMEDVARFYSNEPVGPGHPFYFSSITSSTDNYPLIHFLSQVKPLFPAYTMVDVNPPSVSEEKTLVFAVLHETSKKSRARGYVIFTKDGDHYKRELIPPLWVEEKEVLLEEIHTPDPFRLRELKDWNNAYTYQKKRMFILDHKKDSLFWISYPLPVQNDSSYTITYQFYGPYEDFPVINKQKWGKIHPGEHPDNYYKAREVSENEDYSKELDRDEKARNKLINSATPKDRLYTYSYLVEDINKDGKKEMVSFSVSNGQLLFYKCYTHTPGGLVSLKGDKVKKQIQATKEFKNLYKRSLLAIDMPK